MASILHAMPKHDFGRLVLRVSSEGEKARVYASTKPPRQALTRSINRLAGLKLASSIDLRGSFPMMDARTRGSSLDTRINSKTNEHKNYKICKTKSYVCMRIRFILASNTFLEPAELCRRLNHITRTRVEKAAGKVLRESSSTSIRGF